MSECAVLEEPSKETQKKKTQKEKKHSKQALALSSLRQSQKTYVPVAVDNNGNVTSSHQIALSYLLNSAYSSRISFNSFSNDLLLDNQPFKKDSFCNRISKEIALLYPVNGGIRKDQVWEAIQSVAIDNIYDPVSDFVSSLPKWDKKKRVESFFCRHFGVDNTEYAQHVSKIFFVQALSRLTNPGSKADFVLTLCGPQGLGKSFFGEKIVSVTGHDWFMSADDFGKELVLAMQKKWIVEFAELATLRKREASEIKGFLTKTTDTIRKPYAIEPEDLPRHQVFYASTNEVEFLKDHTGNRRFLPLDCRKEHIVEPIFSVSDDYLFQVWSEALFYLREGFAHWIAPIDLDKVSEEHSVSDQIFEEDFEVLVEKDLAVQGYVSLSSLARRIGATEIWRQSEVRSKLRAKGLITKKIRVEKETLNVWCKP